MYTRLTCVDACVDHGDNGIMKRAERRRRESEREREREREGFKLIALIINFGTGDSTS